MRRGETIQAVTVSLSGPDGAGKTTLIEALSVALVSEGWSVHCGYGYGCFVCRRAHPHTRVPHRAVSRQVPLHTLLHRVHGHIDAAELALRVVLLRFRVCVAPPPRVILFDRGPLDGLAKHGPPAGSPLDRFYRRLAASFDLTVLLDAPASVLAARDKEHRDGDLDRWRDAYLSTLQSAVPTGGHIQVVDCTRAASSIASGLLADIKHIATDARLPPPRGPRRRRTAQEVANSSTMSECG